MVLRHSTGRANEITCWRGRTLGPKGSYLAHFSYFSSYYYEPKCPYLTRLVGTTSICVREGAVAGQDLETLQPDCLLRALRFVLDGGAFRS